MLQAIQEKFDSRPVKIGLCVAGGIAAGLLLYRFFPFGKNNLSIPASQQQRRDSERKLSQKLGSGELQNTEKSLIRVVKGIKKTITDDNINFETLKAIYEGYYQLSRSEIKKLLLKNRADRRSLIIDMKRYLAAITQWDQQQENIHNNHLNAILAHFKIDKIAWGNLMSLMPSEHPEEWVKVQLDCQEQELDAVRNTDKPKIKFNLVIDILRYKAQLLKDNAKMLTETAQDDTDLFTVMEIWIADKVFEKYKVQEEDINYSTQQLNEEEKNEYNHYYQEIKDLLHEIIFGDEQMAKSDTQQVDVSKELDDKKAGQNKGDEEEWEDEQGLFG